MHAVHAVALCGLGPVVDGYSVVATTDHVASAADESRAGSSFASFASSVREKLVARFGSCLMTEHGRLPVCVDPSGTTDPHCFHAHFLMFPGITFPDESLTAYFLSQERADSLDKALSLAREHEEYFLFSQDAQHFSVFVRPARIVRQFARLLVADAIGKPELANWRLYPRREDAVRSATALREMFSKVGT